MRLNSDAGMRRLLKQAQDPTHESALADFAYQREVLPSRHKTILFHVIALTPRLREDCTLAPRLIYLQRKLPFHPHWGVGGMLL